MENTVYSLDDKIDYYLHKIAIAPNLTLDPRVLYEVEVLDEDTCFIDQVMVEKGLVKIDRGVRVITSKGLEISNFGGWYMYQKLLRKESQRQFLESDSNLRKFQRENLSLRKRLEDSETALQARMEKDHATQLIIANLIRQNRSGRASLFLAGMVLGVIIAVVSWILLG
jgi:hypothetical protein